MGLKNAVYALLPISVHFLYTVFTLTHLNVCFMWYFLCAASFTVIAGVPARVLIAQDNPTSDIVSLTSFISPPLSSSSSAISWLFSGDLGSSSLPEGASVVGTEIFLHAPIIREMRGNYTCVVATGEGGASVSAVFLVDVKGEWWGWRLEEMWVSGYMLVHAHNYRAGCHGAV